MRRRLIGNMCSCSSDSYESWDAAMLFGAVFGGVGCSEVGLSCPGGAGSSVAPLAIREMNLQQLTL